MTVPNRLLLDSALAPSPGAGARGASWRTRAIETFRLSLLGFDRFLSVPHRAPRPHRTPHRGLPGTVCSRRPRPFSAPSAASAAAGLSPGPRRGAGGGGRPRGRPTGARPRSRARTEGIRGRVRARPGWRDWERGAPLKAFGGQVSSDGFCAVLQKWSF